LCGLPAPAPGRLGCCRPLRLAARGRRWLAGGRTPCTAMKKGQRRKKAHGIDMYQGQISHFHMWVPHVRSVKLLRVRLVQLRTAPLQLRATVKRHCPNCAATVTRNKTKRSMLQLTARGRNR
jgi:hypothetical protein